MAKNMPCSFVTFDEAEEIFFAFQDKTPPFVNTDRDKFTYALLHQNWGLCVYIIYIKSLNKRFIILRPDSFGIEVFLDTICAENIESKQKFDDKLVLNAEKLKEYLTPLTLNGTEKSQELWSAQIEQDLKSASLEFMWTMSNLILTRYVYSECKTIQQRKT